MILIKHIKLFNSLFTVCMLINVFFYATGRLQLIPLLVIGALQILLAAFINVIEYRMNDLDE